MSADIASNFKRSDNKINSFSDVVARFCCQIVTQRLRSSPQDGQMHHQPGGCKINPIHVTRLLDQSKPVREYRHSDMAC